MTQKIQKLSATLNRRLRMMNLKRILIIEEVSHGNDT